MKEKWPIQLVFGLQATTLLESRQTTIFSRYNCNSKGFVFPRFVENIFRAQLCISLRSFCSWLHSVAVLLQCPYLERYAAILLGCN